MKVFFCLSWIVFSTFLLPGYSACQVTTSRRSADSPAPPPLKDLFDTEELLQISFKGKIRELLNDRTEDPKYHPLVLSYSLPGSGKVEIPVEGRTRGHFRRLKENCNLPPLMIQFPKKGIQSTTIFHEQAKLKLVMPCQDDGYVVREWLVYKIYNLITSKSFRTRLVNVQLEDERNKKLPGPVYGILLEEEKQLALRNHCVSLERKLRPQETQLVAFLTMAVFQYLVGNTDWSVQYQQNIKLIAKDSNAPPFPVAYDFDHAGMVNSPYALPAEELKMTSVQQRRFRGFCVQNPQLFEPVIARFNEVKQEIYALYANCKMLDAKYIKSATRYLDEFYRTINNASEWKKEFAYPCDPKGTGNVVIKGLKTN
jgi:hypothetical protein